VITRHRPTTTLRNFDRLSRLIDEAFAQSDQVARGWSPLIDVRESEREIAFFAELPGLNMEDIQIEMIGEVLSIQGKREWTHDESKENFVRVERSYGAFSRSFTIGVPVKADQITATYKDGVLSVVVPKADEIQPRRIQVTAVEN
jgi:HSP20 family protein